MYMKYCVTGNFLRSDFKLTVRQLTRPGLQGGGGFATLE